MPLVVSWPEKIKSNAVSNALVSFADFLPTFCELAKIPKTNYKTDGKSLLPLFSGKGKIQDEIFIHYSPRWGKWESNRWVTNGKYKLYQNGNFYHTQTDSLELTPLKNLSPSQELLRDRFQSLIDEKEKEIPFHLNDTIFKLQP